MGQEQEDLELCLHFGESLFSGSLLETLRVILHDVGLASGLCAYREDATPARIELIDFSEDLRRIALHRGGLYEQLVTQYGEGKWSRRAGTVEIRSDRASVVVRLDDFIFAPSAGRWLWGNVISVQVGKREAQLLLDFAIRACQQMSPWYARAHQLGEWERQNMSSKGSTMAIGLDASRYLPGLYWLNFFGKPYLNLMGQEALQNVPAEINRSIDNGVLIVLGHDPNEWPSEKYQKTRERMVAVIGNQYFFRKDHPHREDTRAPDFGLEKLQRNPRFT